jgi:hypothetical protein
MDLKRFDALIRTMGDSTSRRGLLSLLGGGVIGSAVVAVGLDEARAKSKHRQKRNKGKGHNGNGGNNSGPQNLGPFEAMTGIPISAHDQGRNFKGTLDILRFEEQNGAIVAIASLTGKVTGNGGGNRPINQQVTVPVSVSASSAGVHAQAICQVLDLILGPIDLNLLGLRLQVNQIHIQLTANSLGGLLGSLLCALTGPLSGLPLLDLLTLLNQILAILQGL